jgi:(p)ppGpp synthase/HD superfamily hydrolase
MSFKDHIDKIDLVNKAQEFATLKHKGQTRKFGGEYIQHPAGVADLVRHFDGTDEMIAAAWLHDVVEDAGVTYEEIEKEFGGEVANLVDLLTTPSVITKDQKNEYLSDKMISMSTKALTIKLCDRLDNVSDFKTASPKFINSYAPATKYILDALENSGRSLTTEQNEIISLIRKKVEQYYK